MTPASPQAPVKFTTRPHRDRREGANPPVRDEAAQLAGEVEQLTVALARASRENTALRRELARARSQGSSRPHHDPVRSNRTDDIRAMLNDRHSRNP
ncbi:MAG: hypothetical protein ACRDPM_15565 [Solirubrobacteraceae bacterium]